MSMIDVRLLMMRTLYWGNICYWITLSFASVFFVLQIFLSLSSLITLIKIFSLIVYIGLGVSVMFALANFVCSFFIKKMVSKIVRLVIWFILLMLTIFFLLISLAQAVIVQGR